MHISLDTIIIIIIIIAEWRVQDSRMESARKGKSRIQDVTVKQYKKKGCLKSAIEDAKQRLTAISHRLQRYTARTEQYKINRMFNTEPRRVYSNFQNNNKKEEAEIPDKQETYRFWNNISGTPKIHNAAEWTQKEYFDVPTQQAQRIAKEGIKNKCNKMANWKSSGLDQVQGYWLKHLTSLRERLAQ